jgi:hypothetical protein
MYVLYNRMETLQKPISASLIHHPLFELAHHDFTNEFVDLIHVLVTSKYVITCCYMHMYCQAGVGSPVVHMLSHWKFHKNYFPPAGSHNMNCRGVLLPLTFCFVIAWCFLAPCQCQEQLWGC